MQAAEHDDDLTPQHQFAVALRDLKEALMDLGVPDRTRTRLQRAHDRVKGATDLLVADKKLPPVASLPPLPLSEEG